MTAVDGNAGWGTEENVNIVNTEGVTGVVGVGKTVTPGNADLGKELGVPGVGVEGQSKRNSVGYACSENSDSVLSNASSICRRKQITCSESKEIGGSSY